MNATLNQPANPRENQVSTAPPPISGQATSDPRSPISRPCRVPSLRNREIFREAVIGGRSKTEVAKDFGVSQPRVSEICEQVRAWMIEHTAAEAEGLTESQRLNLAEHECRMRRGCQCGEAIRAFHQACEGQRIEKEKRNKHGELVSTETVVKSGTPRSGLLNIALRAIIETARLDGIMGSPNTWAGRNRRKLDEFQQQHWEELHQATDRPRPTTVQGPKSKVQSQPGPGDSGQRNVGRAPENASVEPLWNLPPAAVAVNEVAQEAVDATAALQATCAAAPSHKPAAAPPASERRNPYAPPASLPVEQDRAGSEESDQRIARRNLHGCDRRRALEKRRAKAAFFAPLRTSAA